MKSGFISVHPLLAFSYFLIMIILVMLIKNPIYLLTILLITTGLLYFLDHLRSLRKQLKFYLLMALFILILNPIFSTHGTTVLFYLKNRSVTLEGVMYGVTFALSLLNILFLFLGYNLILSPRKFLYLFGNIIPKISFILTIIIGFIPLFTRRMHEIIDVRKTFVKDISKHSYKQHITESMTSLNTLVSWTLEESLENASSMRARGYGTHKRTSATLYNFDHRDYVLIGIGVVLLIILSIGLFLEHMNTFPNSLMQWGYFLCILLFTALPLLIEMREYLRWHFMKSII